MPSGPVQRLHFLQPFTSGVLDLHLSPVLHSPRTSLEMADPTKSRLRPALRLGGVFGFIGGFLLAYQRSSCQSTLFVS